MKDITIFLAKAAAKTHSKNSAKHPIHFCRTDSSAAPRNISLRVSTNRFGDEKCFTRKPSISEEINKGNQISIRFVSFQFRFSFKGGDRWDDSKKGFVLKFPEARERERERERERNLHETEQCLIFKLGHPAANFQRQSLPGI